MTHTTFILDGNRATITAQEAKQMVAQIAALQAQHDVMLKALKDISEESTDPGAVECAIEAIAKAEGGAA